MVWCFDDYCGPLATGQSTASCQSFDCLSSIFSASVRFSPISNESVMIDPICGMEVEPSKAAGNQVYDGQTYFFCSHHCLAKFKEDPEKFLKSCTDEQHHARVH